MLARVLYGQVFRDCTVIPPILSGQAVKLVENNTFAVCQNSHDRVEGIAVFDCLSSSSTNQFLIGGALVVVDTASAGSLINYGDLIAFDDETMRYKVAAVGDYVFGRCLCKYADDGPLYLIKFYENSYKLLPPSESI